MISAHRTGRADRAARKRALGPDGALVPSAKLGDWHAMVRRIIEIFGQTLGLMEVRRQCA
jgi:hypothetical protein